MAEKTGSTRHGKKSWPKIYYATQVAVNPITILTFVNKPELFDLAYTRYIKNKLQQLLPIAEVQIRLIVRARREKR